MIESPSVFAILLLSISFLFYVYNQLKKANLKEKYLKLLIRRKNLFKQDSVDECLKYQQNKQLLNSYFYKVNIVDFYIKKIIPLIIFISIVIFSFSFIGMDKTYNFKIKSLDENSKATYSIKSGVKEDLKEGQILYLSHNGKLYNFTIESGEMISFGNQTLMRIDLLLAFSVVGLLVLGALAVAYFQNLNSIEQLCQNLYEDEQHILDELDSVDSFIKEFPTKSATDYKSDRLNALQDKLANLKKCLKLTKEMKNEMKSI